MSDGMYLIKKTLASLISTYNSKKIFEKIIVIESDDWGGIRTPSIEAAEKIRALGGFTADRAYLDYDTLESESDLISMFKVLSKHRGGDGKFPIITANFVMTNPDFIKIKESNFERYFYEPFTQSYLNYYGSNQIELSILEGIKKSFFYPQFHGREHVNIPLWLAILQSDDKIFKTAFDFNFFGIQTKLLESKKRNIQMTYDLPYSSSYLKESIIDGLSLFQNIFGFRPKSFIPNNYIWNQDWNQVLIDNGVEYLQGIRLQTSPMENDNETRKQIKRFGGREEKFGVMSIVRNCSFEPSFKAFSGKELIARCLSEISLAFLFKQPAVISMHRLNFVSGLSLKNRDENLELLDELLNNVTKRWPEVRFMNTVQLGNYYREIVD
jgi:hypothetical protein